MASMHYVSTFLGTLLATVYAAPVVAAWKKAPISSSSVASIASSSTSLSTSPSPSPSPSSSSSSSSASMHIVSGSVYHLTATGKSTDLDDLNFSDLFGSTTPTTTDSRSFATSTSDCQTCTSPTVMETGAPVSTSTHVSNDKLPSGLSKRQLGAIVGGSVGGVLLISVIVLLIYLRRRKPKFERGRGITPSMVFSDTGSKGNSSSLSVSQRHSTYSFTTPEAAFGSHNYTPTNPSRNTTAALDRMYNIKRYNTTRESEATLNGARLSKYNYLAQALSQMRASSYAVDGNQQLVVPDMTHQRSPNHRELDFQAALSSPSSHKQHASSRELPFSSMINNHRVESTARATNPASSHPMPPRITLLNDNNECEDILNPENGIYDLHRSPLSGNSEMASISRNTRHAPALSSAEKPYTYF